MYAGVYAGNMFLEPCGPFRNFSYASDNFKAIFFGVNCESDRSLASLSEDLTGRNLEISKDETIQVVDTAIIKQNIYSSIASGHLQKVNEDSLRLIMLNNRRNTLGIERVKNWLSANKLLGDIYKDEIALDKSQTFGLLILLSDKD